jgi:[ribosomal protein S5]-alanine N-acetyltransferase
MRSVEIELPKRLTDGVVALRPPRADDAAPYAAAFRDDRDLGRLVGIERDPDEAEVLEGIEGNRERAAQGTGVLLSIADASSDEFLGLVILHSFAWQHRRCEVGFWLVPGARGRGLGARSVALAVSWAFDEFDLLRVELTTTPDNAAVTALAARLGFTREGVLRRRNFERGQRVDIVWFGVLREEWLAPPAGDARPG